MDLFMFTLKTQLKNNECHRKCTLNICIKYQLRGIANRSGCVQRQIMKNKTGVKVKYFCRSIRFLAVVRIRSASRLLPTPVVDQSRHRNAKCYMRFSRRSWAWLIL